MADNEQSPILYSQQAEQQPYQASQPVQPVQQPASQPDQPQPKKPSKALTVVLTIVVFILACAIGVGITNCREEQHADKYGADAEYTVTGTIVKADEKRDSRDNSHTYRVVIETEEELPDGTHTFDSKMNIDYTYTKHHVGKKALITIGKDGHVKHVEDIEDGEQIE